MKHVLQYSPLLIFVVFGFAVWAMNRTNKKEGRIMDPLFYSDVTDEAFHDDARRVVLRVVNDRFAEETAALQNERPNDQLVAAKITMSDVKFVMGSYILGNWKALVTTNITDGRYYEVTYNNATGDTYVDTYKKEANRTF